MTDNMSGREYDIVLVGATGYTGALTAEHIAEHLPTKLKWAIAGRSSAKLNVLAKKLRQLAPDRLQPTLEIVDVQDNSQLGTIVSKARVCISVVSYHYVGAKVIEACIENRTDYIDTAGSIPQLRIWIDRYHDAAKLAGVVLIHACGNYSAPQDLLTWASVQELKKSSLKTKELVLSVLSMPADPSGGTIESMMEGGNFDKKILQDAQQPWYLSPVTGRQKETSSNLFGIRYDHFLGVLSRSALSEVQNVAVVHRTWGLLDDGNDYGSNFQYNEYNKTSSTLAGIMQILNTKAIGLLLTIPPLRAIAKAFLPSPGDGPDPDKEKSYRVDMEAVAFADTNDDKTTMRTYSRFTYPGGPYHATGAFLAQGAAS